MRAEFVQDELATTTGDGKFDYSSDSDYIIDRPPHNKVYFQDQLLALSNYFKHISNGKLVLQADVFPEASEQAYLLNQNMVYYSGEEDEELKNTRWSELVRDVCEIAKEQDDLDFAKYDVFVVFHAGIGSDFAFDFDPTPYDIQSVFLDFQTLKETLGQNQNDYNGIDLGSGVFVREAIILPEMQNQEEYDLGLLGTMTLLMGSQLGMPNLFNTENGRAGIGRWGLMDQGSYNFQGLVPAEPCAWMKLYMGWDTAVTVSNGELSVGSNVTTSAPHILKIPITSDEYFLIENRQKDSNGDGVAFGRDQAGNRAQFDTTGNILIEPNLGVITSVDEYDFGLPGSGILIWHIDESVIRQNLETNTINNDINHRGVDLVECDGAQDIGYYYSMLDAAYGTESGDYFDPYWSGNFSHTIVNESETVAFSSQTIPNSRAYNGSDTHIRIDNFSARDSVMSFSLSSDWAQNGFPQYAGKKICQGGLKIAKMDQESVIIAVTVDGNILGWTATGEKIIPNDSQISVDNINNQSENYDWALLYTCSDSILVAPVIVDLDSDGTDEIIVVTKSGTLTAFQLLDADSDGRADIVFEKALEINPSVHPMVLQSNENTNVVIGANDGSVHVVSINLDLEPVVNSFSVAQTNISGLAATVDESAFVTASASGDISSYLLDGTLLWNRQVLGNGTDFNICSVQLYSKNQVYYIFSNTGEFYILNSFGEIIQNKANLNIEAGIPALGDVNKDGYPEVLFNTKGQLWAVSNTGITSANFPVDIDESVEQFTVPPLFMHGKNKIASICFAANSSGQITAVDQDARKCDGFPSSVGQQINASPLLADIDKDGDVELAAISQDGFLYLWDLDYSADDYDMIWPQFGGRTGRNLFNYKSDLDPVGQDKTGGLLPSESTFCYPNPAENNRTNIRYLLTSDAVRVTIKIYDLTGDLVKEIEASGITAGEHDVTWDVSDIQSGAYIAKVEAENESEKSYKIIKIAVVK